MPSTQPTTKADHLIVLVHGLWGNPKHLNYLRDTITREHPELHILVATSLADNKTYDGVEVGGERVAHEVEERLEELENEGYTITKISVAGYSLGGLISRYAVGLMYSNGLFDRITPVNFTTFATPHLGVRVPNRGWRSYLFNQMGPRTLSTSGQQIFLVDAFRDTGRPLLSILADPHSIFVRGLSLFKNKWLYANTMNDRSVPYYTAMMSRTDPFVELDKINVHYLDPQPEPGEVLLDPAHFVSPRKSPYEDMTLLERMRTIPRRTLNNLPFYMLLITLMPIFIPAFMINAGYQTYQSAQRIRLHESGKAFQVEKYRKPKLLEEAGAIQENIYGRFANQQREQYLPTPPPESATPSESERENERESERLDLRLSRRESAREIAREKSPQHFKILALMEEQFDMIENMDKLGFTKYPVHMQRVRHTHAAIVVRMPRESFLEGKVVVKHWSDKLEV